MALHLDGTTIDFLDGPQGRGFAIDNPNAPTRRRVSGVWASLVVSD